MCNVNLINYGAKCVVVRRRTIDDKKTLAVLLEKKQLRHRHNEKVILFHPPFYAAIFLVHSICRKVNSSFLYVPGIRRYQFGDSKESNLGFSSACLRMKL